MSCDEYRVEELLSLTHTQFLFSEYEHEPRHSGEWIVSCCRARHRQLKIRFIDTGNKGKLFRVRQLTNIQQVIRWSSCHAPIAVWEQASYM